jgi:hypothetical protein
MKDKVFPVLIVLVAVLIRFLPHPANVAPIAAMALFGGAYLNKKYAVILPLIAMLISDLFLGFHNTMPFVYGSFLLTGMIGMVLKKHNNFKWIFGGTLLSSVLFFIITNFGVWLMNMGNMYPQNLIGLAQCYVMAIPFFRNTLAGDLFYTVMMFGGYEMICRFYKKLGAKNLIEQ